MREFQVNAIGWYIASTLTWFLKRLKKLQAKANGRGHQCHRVLVEAFSCYTNDPMSHRVSGGLVSHYADDLLGVIRYRGEWFHVIPMTQWQGTSRGGRHWWHQPSKKCNVMLLDDPMERPRRRPFIPHWSRGVNSTHLKERSHIFLVSNLTGFWQVAVQHWWDLVCACISKQPNFIVKGKTNRWAGCRRSNDHRYTAMRKCSMVNHCDLAIVHVPKKGG